MPIFEWSLHRSIPPVSEVYPIMKRNKNKVLIIFGSCSSSELESLQTQLGSRDIEMRVYHASKKERLFSGSKKYSERVSKYLFMTRGHVFYYKGVDWSSTTTCEKT